MSAWLWPVDGPGDTPAVLVCFPPGGGGAASFRSWRGLVPGHVTAFAVTPPGRGARAAEPEITDVAEYVAAVVGAIRALGAREVWLAGVSLGGVLAFETCRALEDAGERPVALAVVAAVPPGDYRAEPVDRSTEAVRDLVVRWGLTDAELVAHPEFAEVVLPPIVADLKLGDGYDGRAARPVDAPVVAVCGAADAIAPPHVMRGWKAMTTTAFSLSVLDGSHFVHESHAVAVLDSFGWGPVGEVR
ncbi:Thioesterase PikA5 [Actinosynnema sp. ALI-1.44]